eukprot:XP_001693185.1 predicted protein [Chlamydomonas reinhardtii]
MVFLFAGSYERFIFGYSANADCSESAVKCCVAGGPYVASGGADDLIHLYDMVAERDLGSLMNPCDGAVPCLQFFTPEGRSTPSHMLGGSADGAINIWRCRDWEHLKVMRGHKGAVNALAVHPSGKLALSVARDAAIRMWNLVKGRCTYTTRLEAEAEAVAFSHSGDAYSLLAGSRISVFSTDGEGGLKATYTAPRRILCTASQSDNLMLLGLEDGSVRVWDVRTSGVVGGWERAHASRVRGMAILKEGANDLPASLATASSDGTIKLPRVGNSWAQSPSRKSQRNGDGDGAEAGTKKGKKRPAYRGGDDGDGEEPAGPSGREGHSSGAGASGKSPTKAAGGSTAAAASKPTGGIANLPRPKLDPKDFRFVELKGEAKVKPPGSINGQAFTIDNCHDCDLYVVDACGQVTIDDCKNCRIFVGPTDGAVFIRNSSNCTLVAVCRQLRTRDCNNCRLALYCRTRPIVESSSNMQFTCFDMSYPQLADHMKHSKLSAFHNFWWHIYDFTPKASRMIDGFKGQPRHPFPQPFPQPFPTRLLPPSATSLPGRVYDASRGDPDGNWDLLPAGSTAASLLQPIPQEPADVLAGKPPAPAAAPEGGEQQQPEPAPASEPAAAPAPSGPSPVLLTCGGRAGRPAGSYMFAMFEGGKQDAAMQLARAAAEQGWLLHTNEAKLNGEAAGQLVAEAGWAKSAAKALSAAGTAAVGLELVVPEAEAESFKKRLAEAGGLVSASEGPGKAFRTMGVDG